MTSTVDSVIRQIRKINPRVRLLTLLILLSAALLLWMILRGWVLERTLHLDLKSWQAGTKWVLDWERSADGYKNGQWLDPWSCAGWPVESQDQTGIVDGPRNISLDLALPNYQLKWLRLSWQNSPRVRFQLVSARLSFAMLGRPLASRQLTPQARHGVLAEPGDEAVFRAQTASGAIWLTGDFSDGWAVELLGTGLTLAALLMALLLAAWLLPGLIAPPQPDGPPSPRREFPHWVWALALVVAARVWMLTWVEPTLNGDAADYIAPGYLVSQGGDFLAGLVPWRLPGYAVFIMPFILWFSDYLYPLILTQMLLSVASTGLAYLIARRFLPGLWAALVMALFGLLPMWLASEQFVQTETLVTFLLMVTVWLTVRVATRDQPTIAWLLQHAALLGLVCALAAYVRGNMLLLIGWVPFQLAAAGWRRWPRRHTLFTIGLAGAVSLAAITPWIVYNKECHGIPAWVVGSGRERYVGAWVNSLVELNQIRYIGASQLQKVWNLRDKGKLNLWLFSSQVCYRTAPLSVSIQGWQRPELRKNAAVLAKRAVLLRDVTKESRHRRPATARIALVRSLAQQLGFNPMHDISMANECLGGVNLISGKFRLKYNLAGLENVRHFSWLAPAFDRVRRDVSQLDSNRSARLFRSLGEAYEWLRPVVGGLFLLGLLQALAGRRFIPAGLGMLALGHAAVMALLFYCPIDRYSLPFQPIFIMLAVYPLYRLSCWARKLCSPGTQNTAPRAAGENH